MLQKIHKKKGFIGEKFYIFYNVYIIFYNVIYNNIQIKLDNFSEADIRADFETLKEKMNSLKSPASAITIRLNRSMDMLHSVQLKLDKIVKDTEEVNLR